MPSSDGLNMYFSISHKKYRRTGEAAWPEVLIAFCMQNTLKSSNEDRARANGIVMAQNEYKDNYTYPLGKYLPLSSFK